VFPNDLTLVAGRASGGRALAPPGPDTLLAHAIQLAEELARCWRSGQRRPAEELLAGAPELRADAHALFAVVAEEVRLRRELGPAPSLDEFLARFPTVAAPLIDLFLTGRSVPTLPKCGEVLGECQLLAELGSGANGRAFLATQPLLADRPLVVKVTPCGGSEHLALARLLHAHIVPVLFVQDVPGRNLRVLAMPYLGGATLAQVMEELSSVPRPQRTGGQVVEALDRVQARAPLSVTRTGPARAALARLSYPGAVCWIGACLADALQHAHERQLVHLDIKPSNVLLAGDGGPLLLDFHLARAPLPAGAPAPLWFGGTASYMSPEQRLALAAVPRRLHLPARVDGRSDIYSLGALLYELLAGALPPDEPPRAISRALRQRNPTVSVGLADILGRCLAPSADDRYGSASAVAMDLRLHLSHRPLRGVANRSLGERWRKWRQRRPHALARLALAVLALFGLVSALGLGSLHLDGQRRAAAEALTEGRRLIAEGRAAEAERELARASASAEWLPNDLKRALAEERQRATGLREEGEQQARRKQLAGELAELSDELRFFWDVEALAPKQARKLGGRCARVWSQRQALVTQGQPEARENLLDLAVLWSELRAGKDEAGAQRAQALGVLDEAERLLGPSAVLAQQRLRFRSPGAPLLPPALAPRTPWEHYAVGRALFRAGQPERAWKELARAVAGQPNGFWPNFYQGACAYRLGRHEDAVAAFRACVTLAPNSAPCYHNRALALSALGRSEEARHDLDRAVRLAPKLGPAWLQRGLLHYQGGNLIQARTDLHEALRQGASPVSAHYNLALVCLALHDRAGAKNHLRQVLAHQPEHAGARAQLARLGP
jgi:tetratricopeptide (TPR) repeat protein